MPDSQQYLIYLRKSRQDIEAEARGEGDTLARHRRVLTELAEHRGLIVGDVYDEVVSGDTIAARPKMKRLLSEVEAGLWRGVIVMEIERLARGDSVDQGVVARTFKYSETLIVTPFKTFDPNNEYDEEYFEFGLFMSRREYKTIRRRLSAGVQAARREGKYTPGQPPFGYQKIKLKNEKGGSLVPDPETAPIVRDVFLWYLYDGLTIADIKHRLNQLLPPPPGERLRWYDRRVSIMLRNPHYAGYTTSTRRPTRKEVVDGKLKTIRTKSKEVELYPGRHEALVSPEEWSKIQEMLSRNFTPPVPRGKTQKNPFTGLIYCGQCGKRMQRTNVSTGQTVPREPMFFCISRTACTTISHRCDEVERMVLDTLRSWLSVYSSGQLLHTQSDLASQLQELISQQEKQLSDLDARINRAFELVETGVYTPELYVERKSALDAERASIMEQIDKLRFDLDKLSNDEAIRRDFVPKLRHVVDSYESTETALEKNKLLKSVISKIIYTKTVRVTSNNPGNLNLQVLPLLPHTPATM